MINVFIIYDNFFDAWGEHLTIGGIQTYLKTLGQVIIELKMQPIIMQYSDIDFKKEYNGIIVHGYKDNNRKKRRKQMVEHCEKEGNIKDDILIFGSHIFYSKSNFKKVICIQHGISWDIPIHEHFFKFSYKRFLQIAGTLYKIKRANYVVCVDYNFLNWYRTVVPAIKNKISVIPNFTNITNVKERTNRNVKIIFARRFWYYRGTRLFSDAIKLLFDKGINIDVTFAGEGPDEKLMKNIFEKNSCVNFIKYDSEKSIDVHSLYDIAVVPTLGSEGTSLSLLEAMSAGCAVIATNVGGMTNIIIDRYNGLLVNPDKFEIASAIEYLAANEETRKKLGAKARETVEQGFSLKIWEEKWKKVFLSFT